MVFTLALVLVQLHGPNSQTIWVNPQEVVSVRAPRAADHFGGQVRCLIEMTDGKFVNVTDTCDDVIAVTGKGG